MRTRTGQLARTSLGILLLSASVKAAEPPTREQCATAYVDGQRLQKDGKLLDARRALLICARDPCPTTFQGECSQWLANVDKATPSVVISVHGPVDAELTQVRVFVDDSMVADHLDGRVVQVDPGERTFRLEAGGYASFEQKVLIHEGEAARVLTFKLQAEARSAESATGASNGRPSWLAYGFGGLGAAGLASFGTFGALVLVKSSELNQCKGYCPASEVDTAKTYTRVADISLAIAVVSFGAATYFFLRRSSAPVVRDAGLRFVYEHANVTVAPRSGSASFDLDF